MDSFQQITLDLNDIENKFTSLVSTLRVYGITIPKLLFANETSSINDISSKINRPFNEVSDYIKHVKRSLDDSLIENSIDLSDESYKNKFIPTGIIDLDSQLKGGLPISKVSEIFGSSGCGKSQFLIQLLVQAQIISLPNTKKSIYISTESGLETNRLKNMIDYHCKNLNNDSILMDNVEYVYCDDLESQDHILNTQLPVKLMQEPNSYNLIIIDSIGNHLRRDDIITNNSTLIENLQQQEKELESDVLIYQKIKSTNKQQIEKFFKSNNEFQARIEKKQSLLSLYRSLVELAEMYNVAIVVANQVSDQPGNETNFKNTVEGIDDVLNYNFQLGQFSGWDNSTIRNFQQGFTNPTFENNELEDEISINQLAQIKKQKQNMNQTPQNQKQLSAQSNEAIDFDPRFKKLQEQNKLSDIYDQQKDIIYKIHNSKNRETKRIIPSLGFHWAKSIQCKLLLLKNYRPILKDKQDVLDTIQTIDPETGISFNDLMSDLSGSSSSQEKKKRPHSSLNSDTPISLIDGYEVQRYVKIVSHPFMTSNQHNQSSNKIPFAILQHGLV